MGEGEWVGVDTKFEIKRNNDRKTKKIKGQKGNSDEEEQK
jgi:hypothetical protein